MTRKENLLIEIYNLRNQISEIKGNKIVNIEEFSQTRKFRDEASEWKEFELRNIFVIAQTLLLCKVNKNFQLDSIMIMCSYITRWK